MSASKRHLTAPHARTGATRYRHYRGYGLALLLLLAGSCPADAVRVSTAPLSALKIAVQQSAPATLIALRDTTVSAQIQGIVETIRFATGDRIQAGETLLTIDCSEHTARLRAARAQLDALQASHELSRYLHAQARSLRKSSTISEEQEQQRRTEVAVAKANIEAQRARIDELAHTVGNCKVTAPFAGTLLERRVSPGDWVAPGSPVFRLLDTGSIEVSAEVPATKIRLLRDAVAMHIALGEQSYPVAIRTILPIVDSRTKATEVRLNGTTAALPPVGSSARLVWSDGANYLPADLLVERQGVLGVFIARDEVARFVELPDARHGHPAATGLTDDVRIIIDGRYSLTDGAAITP